MVVDVGATSLNRLDVVQRNGWFQMPGFHYPHIAGMDVAGTVSAVGDAVEGVSVGDRVVVDPSLAGVADNSKLAGMGDLFGELGIIGGTVDGGYARSASSPAVTCTPFPTTCRSNTPPRSPRVTSRRPTRSSTSAASRRGSR